MTIKYSCTISVIISKLLTICILLQQASLVWIENEEENDFITQEFEPLGTDPWLGYIKCNKSNTGVPDTNISTILSPLPSISTFVLIQLIFERHFLLSIDNTWIWLDAGSPVGPEGYVNFQGDGSTDGDNICTHMTSDGSWINSPCDSTFGFVCQMPAGKLSFLKQTASTSILSTRSTFMFQGSAVKRKNCHGLRMCVASSL